MKLYRDYENASIQMVSDTKLDKHLRALSDSENIHYIFETGTYKGLGSTTTIANAFVNSPSLKRFYTCEVNFQYHRIAKRNLSKFHFVECLYGLTLDFDDAIEFIENDNVLMNHEDYPDIYIDTLENPKDFYTNELRGILSNKKRFWEIFTRRRTNIIENLLCSLEGNILVTLDSAGAVGYLEFLKVCEVLKDRQQFWILLDDTHHLKHFRSKRDIEADSKFSLIDHCPDNGWLLAKYSLS